MACSDGLGPGRLLPALVAYLVNFARTAEPSFFIILSKPIQIPFIHRPTAVDVIFLDNMVATA